MTTENSRIVNKLKEYRDQYYVSGRAELSKDIGDLVYTDPFAFLVGAVFDRGMPWQKAWEIPYHIAQVQKKPLDAATLAAMAESELEHLLKSLPVQPRYGSEQGAKTLWDIAMLVARDFNGDAAAIWRDSSPAEVEKRLQRIRGVGSGIASMITLILHDDWGIFQEGRQRWQLDIKPDVHVKRVFQRTGLIDSNSPDEAKRAAWILNPDFPGELDWPAFTIGRKWCHAKFKKRNCKECHLKGVCPSSSTRRKRRGTLGQ